MKELRTERLILRKLREEDAQRIFDFWAADPEVTKFLTWPPHQSVEVTKAVMARWMEEYARPDCYRYGIELKETGELIGMIDVVHFTDGLPVIGYCSGRPAWGHGYMTEALKAVCAALFADGRPAILIEALCENIGSNRVIQKAGFRQTGTREIELKGRAVTVNSYRLDRG